MVCRLVEEYKPGAMHQAAGQAQEQVEHAAVRRPCPREELVAAGAERPLADPPAEVERLLRVACYDCHSGQPRYPWYANITPVNWWLTSHIHEGREKFDATTWATVPAYELVNAVIAPRRNAPKSISLTPVPRLNSRQRAKPATVSP